MITADIFVWVDGKLVRKQEMRSFLRNFAILLNSALKSTAYTYTRIDGTTSNYYPYYSWSVKKVLMGTSNTPVSTDDYNLASLIGDGEGDGLLYYEGLLFGDVSNINSNSFFYVYQTATNLGSVNIDVAECGVLIYVSDVSSYPVLVTRDVFALPISVSPSSAITIAYKFNFPV